MWPWAKQQSPPCDKQSLALEGEDGPQLLSKSVSPCINVIKQTNIINKVLIFDRFIKLVILI